MTVDPQAFARGDAPAILAVIRQTLPHVWGLARGGFVTTDPEGTRVWVKGLADADAAEELTALAIADGLAPAQRSAADPLASVWTAAQKRLWVYGLKNGHAVSLIDAEEQQEVPANVPVLEPARAPQTLGSPTSSERMQSLAEAVRAACEFIVNDEGQRSKELVKLLWREGKSTQECAQTFGCGVHAVQARQSRLQRKIRLRMRRHPPNTSVGPAMVDLALAQDPDGLPTPLYERMAKDAASRISPSEPRPFGARLGWGLGISAVAAAGFAAMFFGLIPGPGDDVELPVAVSLTCDGPCGPGKSAQVKLLAPGEASKVALFERVGDNIEPLLVAPGGGGLTLPLGASDAMVPLPYSAKLGDSFGADATVVAVFSDSKMTGDATRSLAHGKLERKNVTVVTATISGT